MSAVTDSSSGIPKNVYEIHKLFREKNELEKLYADKKGKYKEIKEALIRDISAFIKPLREKRAALENDKSRVLEILKSGGEKARAIAAKKMDLVHSLLGTKLY